MIDIIIYDIESPNKNTRLLVEFNFTSCFIATYKEYISLTTFNIHKTRTKTDIL